MMRFLIAVLAPLLLVGCILTPGKFVSTMTINADRTFAFTYKGEVYAIDPSSALKGIGDKPATEESPTAKPTVYQIASTNRKQGKPPEAAPDADSETKNREIAASLSKELGYRSVVYKGKGKFVIDYAINGTLTHNFVYPFNSDAEAVFPFIVIELRQGNTVRIKAPGFAKGSGNDGAAGGMGGGMGQDSASKLLDGTFTLDTDAEVISQNNEDGAKTIGGRRVISWRATPLTKDAPTAVLKLAR
jgi:hypothetical protein